MYDSMRWEFHWPCMATVVLTTARECQLWARSCRTTRREHKIRLFPPIRPLKLFTFVIFGSLPKAKAGKQFIVVMTDRLLNLTKVTPTAKGIVTTVAAMLVNDWVLDLRVPSKVLVNNGQQLAFKF